MEVGKCALQGLLFNQDVKDEEVGVCNLKLLKLLELEFEKHSLSSVST